MGYHINGRYGHMLPTTYQYKYYRLLCAKCREQSVAIESRPATTSDYKRAISVMTDRLCDKGVSLLDLTMDKLAYLDKVIKDEMKNS